MPRERLIIDNRTDMPMNDVLQYVAKVIDMGRISDEGRSYCYATSFVNGIVIAAIRNKRSDRLLIYKAEANRC